MTLYDTDFYAWTQEQTALLREGAWGELDLEHLIEEMEGLARSDYRAVSSAVYQILVHLLKWRHQPRRQGKRWRSSLVEHRNRLEDDLTATLRAALPEMVAAQYPRACRKASAETGLPLTTFPETCPWKVEQILDHEYYPDGEALP
jgi:hypothetical protein